MNTTIPSVADRSPVGDQLAALVGRNLRTSARVPQLLLFSLTMPMAMLVLFSQVFRSVADGPGFPAGVSYIDFLTPALLAVSTVMAGTNAGVAAAIDHTNGLHDRFAALPLHPGLPGLARTINEAGFTVARAAILGVAAVALGFGFHGSVADAAAGIVVLVGLAGAMSALFGLIGDRLRRPDVVQFAGMMVMMPFMFVSSAFAPLATMPGWMQAAATLNPVAHATDALRGHVLGTATVRDTATALVAAGALWATVTVLPGISRRRAIAPASNRATMPTTTIPRQPAPPVPIMRADDGEAWRRRGELPVSRRAEGRAISTQSPRWLHVPPHADPYRRPPMTAQGTDTGRPGEGARAVDPPPTQRATQ